jgi:uncharacterized protein (TIGR02271 family)
MVASPRPARHIRKTLISKPQAGPIAQRQVSYSENLVTSSNGKRNGTAHKAYPAATLVTATMQSRTDDDRNADQAGEEEGVLPLAAEEVAVTKQVVETGRVQIARVAREREQLIDELLAHETVEISRAPIGQPIDAMPAVREEGDTIVIPLVEEVLVTERRLFLKEEVRVRKARTTERHQESVTLRHQEAVITRHPVDKPAADESPETGEKVRQSNQE